MNNSTLKDIQMLSGYIYHEGKYKLPENCERISTGRNFGNGFFGEAYYKNGNIYIIYRGTDIKKNKSEKIKDISNDLTMWASFQPAQLKNAKNFCSQIKENNKGKQLYVGGHSLGGSLAQIVGSTTEGVKAITFNAYGTKHIRNFEPKFQENVVNYGNSKDLIFNLNIDKHVGKIMIIPNQKTDRQHTIKFHGVNEMGNLDSAIEYQPRLSPAKRLEQRLRREWEESTVKRDHSRDKFKNTQDLKGYYNEIAKNDRIFTEDEISRFSTKDKNKHHAAIEYQRKTIGIPSSSQVKKAISSGGMVHVKAYTRADGVQVHSYYRSAPHR